MSVLEEGKRKSKKKGREKPQDTRSKTAGELAVSAGTDGEV